MTKKMNIVVSMDCEPVRLPGLEGPATSGPASYADSERFIAGFEAIAASYGLPVSLFVHPEAALAHAAQLLEMEQRGAALGLHIHPYKYDPVRWRAHFGELSADEQRAIVSECVALWQQALGRRPQYFRPGTFSANDATFQVLVDLGFVGGSCSCPGRVFPELYAVWAGAPADPHRAHAVFRQRPGTLPFANLPLSVDLSDVRDGDGHQQLWDLRPDYREADYSRIADHIVAQIARREPRVPMVMVVSHNDNDYNNPDDRVARNLRRSLDAVMAACRSAGYEPVGTTVADVCAQVLASPPEVPDWVVGRASIQAGGR
jgi:peptidoglycan/xylan/chitin deacetylase (PgdA/CDA1 family)